jgi:hypothetical protein
MLHPAQPARSDVARVLMCCQPESGVDTCRAVLSGAAGRFI